MFRDRVRRSREQESGFTLIELLVTVALMSIGLLVVFGGIGMFLRSTTVHRSSADTDQALRTYAEQIASPATAYNGTCPTDYSGAVPVPTGFTASIQAKYWDGNESPAGYSSTCPANDKGAQQLTITLTRTADSRQDTLVIVKRQP
jgi:prepilin-type N-terminal cleavage/methylation domain-containing protein